MMVAPQPFDHGTHWPVSSDLYVWAISISARRCLSYPTTVVRHSHAAALGILCLWSSQLAFALACCILAQPDLDLQAHLLLRTP